MGTNKRDHIRPVLKKLHWLPIDDRIVFKILLLTFKGPPSPKMHCAPRSPNLNFMSHEIIKKLVRSVIIVFFHYKRIMPIYILIRLCKYVPCLSFYSFPVFFCRYSVCIYKISRLKLTSNSRRVFCNCSQKNLKKFVV